MQYVGGCNRKNLILPYSPILEAYNVHTVNVTPPIIESDVRNSTFN